MISRKPLYKGFLFLWVRQLFYKPSLVQQNPFRFLPLHQGKPFPTLLIQQSADATLLRYQVVQKRKHTHTYLRKIRGLTSNLEQQVSLSWNDVFLRSQVRRNSNSREGGSSSGNMRAAHCFFSFLYFLWQCAMLPSFPAVK